MTRKRICNLSLVSLWRCPRGFNLKALACEVEVVRSERGWLRKGEWGREQARPLACSQERVCMEVEDLEINSFKNSHVWLERPPLCNPRLQPAAPGHACSLGVRQHWAVPSPLWASVALSAKWG